MTQHKAKLLYFEKFADEHDAAKREQEIKGWWKGKNFLYEKLIIEVIFKKSLDMDYHCRIQYVVVRILLGSISSTSTDYYSGFQNY